METFSTSTVSKKYKLNCMSLSEQQKLSLTILSFSLLEIQISQTLLEGHIDIISLQSNLAISNEVESIPILRSNSSTSRYMPYIYVYTQKYMVSCICTQRDIYFVYYSIVIITQLSTNRQRNKCTTTGKWNIHRS